MGVDRVDGYVELLRDLGPRQVCREISQHAEFARAEFLRLRQPVPIDAGERFASQQVNDVSEKGAMGRFVTRQRIEQLRGLGHSERENQPVRLGGRKRCLGCRGGGASIPQAQVRDTSEQIRFDERERRPGRGRDVRNVSKYVQRTAGVSLRHADHRARVVNETGNHPTGFGRESV